MDPPPPASKKCTPAQEALVRRALHLLEKRPRYYARKYDGLLDVEAAAGAAKIALMEAVHRYDPALDEQFEGYAKRCIDGRILDLVRILSGRRRIERAMDRAAAAHGGLGRSAYDVLQDSDEKLEALAVDASAGTIGVMLVGGALEAERAAAEGEDPEVVAAFAQVIGALVEGAARLSEDERDAMVAVHLDGMTLEAAAEALGATFKQVRGRLARGQGKLKRALLRRGIKEMPAVVPGVSSLSAALRRALVGGGEQR